MKTVTFIVAGKSLQVPAPYEAGHTLNPNEAATLNQTYRENIRNGCAQKVKEAATPEEGQAIVDDYAKGYEFGSGRSGGLPPLEREMKKLATAAVNNALKEKGINKKEYAKFDEAVANIMSRPKVKEQAQKILDAQAASDIQVNI